MNNDLISREALKEALQYLKWINYDNSGFSKIHNNAIQKCIDEIDNAPTFDLDDFYGKAFRNGEENTLKIRGLNERPQVEWGKWVISEIQCPNCFEYFETDCYSTEELKKCPNCGADMKGGAE